MANFNQYLYFDGWIVLRDGIEIKFSKAASIDLKRKKVKKITL